RALEVVGAVLMEVTNGQLRLAHPTQTMDDDPTLPLQLPPKVDQFGLPTDEVLDWIGGYPGLRFRRKGTCTRSALHFDGGVADGDVAGALECKTDQWAIGESAVLGWGGPGRPQRFGSGPRCHTSVMLIPPPVISAS